MAKPKFRNKPDSDKVKVAADPESYLKQKPVWRFSDFDWEGPWGLSACKERLENLQQHISNHLSSFESMTWDEILKASGGKGDGKGNNNHSIDRDKLKKDAIARLDVRGVKADTIFSLRLDSGTRLYGVREGNCLRIALFDPFHKDRKKCAYEFSS